MKATLEIRGAVWKNCPLRRGPGCSHCPSAQYGHGGPAGEGQARGEGEGGEGQEKEGE